MMFSETRVRKTGKKRKVLTDDIQRSHHENKKLSLGRTFFWKVGFLSRGNKRTRLYKVRTQNCEKLQEFQ